MANVGRKPPQKPFLETVQEEIRTIAGEIFKKRSAFNQPGDALSDWLQAEKEVKKKYGL